MTNDYASRDAIRRWARIAWIGGGTQGVVLDAAATDGRRPERAAVSSGASWVDRGAS